MTTPQSTVDPWSAEQAEVFDLFQQHFNSLWDFLARLVRRQPAVEELLIATFQRARDEVANRPASVAPRAWLFGIARELALVHIEADNRPLPLTFQRINGRAVDLDWIDASRLPDEADQRAVRKSAATVWEEVAALNPRQYSLLDLTLRQGLSAEAVAGLLEMPVDDAYTMLQRLAAGVEESIDLFLITREARGQCPGLAVELRIGGGGPGLTAENRQAVVEHVASCPDCRKIKAALPSPLVVIAGFARLRPPPDAREAVLDTILQSRRDPHSRSAWNLPLVIGGVVAILGGLLLLGSTLSVAASEPAAAPAPTTTGLEARFQTVGGDPVPGVTVRIEITPAAGPPSTIERTTAGSGTLDLSDRGPGRYQLTIVNLPPELGTVVDTAIADVIVESHELVSLTGTIRETGSSSIARRGEEAGFQEPASDHGVVFPHVVVPSERPRSGANQADHQHDQRDRDQDPAATRDLGADRGGIRLADQHV